MRSIRNESLVISRRSKVKMRTCLRCGSKFLSEGPWNRFCEDCAQRNAGLRFRQYSVPSEWPDTIRLEINN